jgi:hypothetical protein
MITLLGAAVLIQAAQPVRIPDEPSCARCAITVRDVATLVQPETDYGWPYSIRVDGRRRYWMNRELAVPLIFDENGRAPRPLGAKGSGPDEYAGVDDILFAGDTTVVIDLRNARVSILGPSLKTARALVVQEQMMASFVVSWPGEVIGNASQYTRDAKAAFMQVSFTGDRVSVSRRFGPANADAYTAGGCTGYRFAGASGGAFWAATGRCAYDLIEYSLDGRERRRLERRPDWYPESSRGSIGTRTRPPDPHIADIERDASGLLWVYIRTPRSTWKEMWEAVSRGTGELASAKMEWEKLYDLRIEVIDLAAGRVVARQSFAGYLMNALPGQRAAFRQRLSDGDERTVIREFRLTGR